MESSTGIGSIIISWHLVVSFSSSSSRFCQVRGYGRDLSRAVVLDTIPHRPASIAQ